MVDKTSLILSELYYLTPPLFFRAGGCCSCPHQEAPMILSFPITIAEAIIVGLLVIIVINQLRR